MIWFSWSPDLYYDFSVAKYVYGSRRGNHVLAYVVWFCFYQAVLTWYDPWGIAILLRHVLQDLLAMSSSWFFIGARFLGLRSILFSFPMLMWAFYQTSPFHISYCYLHVSPNHLPGYICTLGPFGCEYVSACAGARFFTLLSFVYLHSLPVAFQFVVKDRYRCVCLHISWFFYVVCRDPCIVVVVCFLSLSFPFVLVEGWLYSLPNELCRAAGRLFACCGLLLFASVVFRIFPVGMRRNSLGRDP